MLQIWGNQRLLGMDENIWEAKNGLNNPILSSLPPHHCHTYSHILGGGRPPKNTVEGTGSGEREKQQGLGREGGEAGNEARKPQAHTAAMTYCELGQVTAAYKRISPSEHGQRRISASQMTDSTYREQCCIHWRWKDLRERAQGACLFQDLWATEGSQSIGGAAFSGGPVR